MSLDIDNMAMFPLVKKTLDDDDWNYQVVREGKVIKSGAKGENGSYAVAFDIKEDRDLFIIYVISNNNFPKDCRVQLAKYLTYCNYAMTLGCFEMDMSDGEIRYKNSVNVVGSRLSKKMVEEMLQVSLVVMDRYYGGMMKVAYGGADPKTVYDQIHNSD